MQQEYSGKGLTILGVTTEDKKDTENWIKSKGVKYAYAYDKTGRLHDKLGISGIPHSILFDARGKIVWEGHPAELTPEIIEGALAGALPRPLFEFPPSTSAVKNALAKHNYALALSEAAKVPESDGGKELKSVVEGIVTARVAGMNASLKEGDLLGAHEQASALKKELEGLPEAAEAEKTLAAIKSDKSAERVIAGQKKLHAMSEKKVTRKADFERLVADLEKMSKDYAGTFVAKEADDCRTAAIKAWNAKK